MSKSPILLLALGNDLLGDDGVALAAARALAPQLNHDLIQIVESSEAGLALMEIMCDYEKALLIDSVQTKQHPVGSIIEFTENDFRKVIAPSPHYAGLPEILETAKRLEIDFPKEIKILGLEVENPFDFSEEFTPKVNEALPTLIHQTKEILKTWEKDYNKKKRAV